MNPTSDQIAAFADALVRASVRSLMFTNQEGYWPTLLRDLVQDWIVAHGKAMGEAMRPAPIVARVVDTATGWGPWQQRSGRIFRIRKQGEERLFIRNQADFWYWQYQVDASGAVVRVGEGFQNKEEAMSAASEALGIVDQTEGGGE